MFVPPFPHQDQVWERLKFVSDFAKAAGITINGDQLSRIFAQCSESGITKDMEMFFEWSSDAVKNQSIEKNVIDQFFRQKLLEDNKMKLDNLPMAGYEYLCEMFVQENKQSKNIAESIKIPKKKVEKMHRVRPR